MTDTLEFTLVRDYKASPEAVFDAWTKPELITEWWLPEGYSVAFVKPDLRVGGTTLIAENTPGGETHYVTNHYLRVETNSVLEFEYDWADAQGARLDDPTTIGNPPELHRDVRHFLVIEPRDGGVTRLTISEYGYTSEPVMNDSIEGLTGCLDRIGRLIEN